ncbi:MAG: type I CRISPR-associated protein Cas7 [Bacteroidetes bacterium]|nr:type I CRISPR-associated protein Cas7 [Bacteroidota bacterium]
MSTTEFKNRVFGCVILKSINSNFNADFTHHPRTLPDGVVYSTDKALKYAVKDYFRKHLNDSRLFYVKRFDDKMNPKTLNETYKEIFGNYPKAPIEKYSLFFFDGETVTGVLPERPKKKQVTDFFKSLEEDSPLKKYSASIAKLTSKDVAYANELEVKTEGLEGECYFHLNKEKQAIKIEGELEELKELSEKLDLVLTGGVNKFEVLGNLLTCGDIRLFGATYADGIGKVNISIHGPVQINHGVNRYIDEQGNVMNEIYTEDILSPFTTDKDKQMSTIGNQTNLKEGHYVFHFSINPKNTEEFYKKVNNGKGEDARLCLSTEDIQNLKEGLNNSVTALDSSRKIGTENEATVFVELTEGSKKMLPSFTEMVSIKRSGERVKIDCTLADQNIRKIDGEVASVEVFYNPTNTTIIGLDKGGKVKHFNILNNEEIK